VRDWFKRYEVRALAQGAPQRLYPTACGGACAAPGTGARSLAGGRGALRAPHALGHGGAAVVGAGAGTAGGAARKCRLHFLSARQPASGRPYYAQDLMIDPRGLLNYWRSGGENLLPIPA
jgi:hypothetical protein